MREGDAGMVGGGVQPRATTVEAVATLLRPARRIVAFTGAGISTESGIPDYRGPDGVWTTGAIPTLAGFRDDSVTQRAYWEGRRTRYPEMLAKRPNRGHAALVALERAGRLSEVITQNIDGLHQAAGHDPDRVLELHGSSHVIRCLDCGRRWPAADVQVRLDGGESVPRCDVCGGPMRAATVLFGEALPQVTLDRAMAAASGCDAMVVIGSSLVVQPAARLPSVAKRAGARLVIVNRTSTPLDAEADGLLRAEAGPALDALVAGILASEP